MVESPLVDNGIIIPLVADNVAVSSFDDEDVDTDTDDDDDDDDEDDDDGSSNATSKQICPCCCI